MFAARLIVTETGQALVKPGFALGELLFFESEHEKTDAEAAPKLGERRRRFYSFNEEAFAEALSPLTSIERAHENSSRNVD
jgi:hypothetical protein